MWMEILLRMQRDMTISIWTKNTHFIDKILIIFDQKVEIYIYFKISYFFTILSSIIAWQKSFTPKKEWLDLRAASNLLSQQNLFIVELKSWTLAYQIKRKQNGNHLFLRCTWNYVISLPLPSSWLLKRRQPCSFPQPISERRKGKSKEGPFEFPHSNASHNKCSSETDNKITNVWRWAK